MPERLIIIENPSQLKLAQLMQLRGQMGRVCGSLPLLRAILYKSSLSKTAQSRLQILHDSNDGFIIAQLDLEIHGLDELLSIHHKPANTEFLVADLLCNQA